MVCGAYTPPTYNVTGPCDYHVYMHSPQGCPVVNAPAVTLEQVSNSVNYLLGVFLIICGLFITTCSKRVNTFITEFLMAILLCCLMISSFKEFTETKNFWTPTTEAQWLRLVLVVSIAAVLSMIIVRFFGIIVKLTIKVGPMIVGTMLGLLTIFLILSSVGAILNMIGSY